MCILHIIINIMYFFVVLTLIQGINCSISESIQTVANIPKTTLNQIGKQYIQLQDPNYTFVRNLLSTTYSEDGLLNFTGLAKKYIRPAEQYEVTTEDGYILKLFRISGNESKIVLVGHGLFSSSDDFLTRGNISIIYMLAKRGFDVWVMNFRGTRYSRKHVKLNPDISKKYWQFSMHEMGLYDYKTAIDFILNKTGQEQLSVTAHSEGTSAFFILMAEKPEYNKKIKVFIALAPVCYLRHAGPTLQTLAKLGPTISTILKVLGVEELIGYHSLTKKFIDFICSRGKLGYELCFKIGFRSITGFNPKNIEQEFIPTFLGHYPTGSSRKNLLHYVHVYHLDRFCQFDYGAKNIAVYGSVNPPNYDLNKVTTNVALFAAKGDMLVGVEDITRLKNELRNVVHYNLVSDDTFNHNDYTSSNNAHRVLYPYVIDILIKYL